MALQGPFFGKRDNEPATPTAVVAVTAPFVLVIPVIAAAPENWTLTAPPPAVLVAEKLPIGLANVLRSMLPVPPLLALMVPAVTAAALTALIEIVCNLTHQALW